MGGVVGALMCLFCRSGCQGSVVASALAFHPPEPQYSIHFDEDSQSYKITFADAAIRELPNLKVDILSPKKSTKVSVLIFTNPGAKYTILYSHGNATDCGAMLPLYAMLAAYLKVNVIGYDYTGYGPSMDDGYTPTEKQTYTDILTVYNYCIEKKLIKDPSKELILYGQSVGSGPSCYLASKKPIAGIVLHSPILSGLRVMTNSRSLACFDIFPNINRIKRIQVPLFIIHGKNDIEVGLHHGTGLLEAAPVGCRYEPWWVLGRGHNDVLLHNENEFIRRMAAFLEHITDSQAKGTQALNSVVVATTANTDVVCLDIPSTQDASV